MRRTFIAALLCVLARPAAPCTTFCLRGPDGRVVFGKNYDYNVADGLVMVNARGATGRWTARYGSVTFNQYGRGEPNGGMNEAGLVVELMWADGSRYPDKDGRLALDCLEWIQYQLDTAATVGEVIANDAKVRIESDVPLHYLVADRSGAAATIEFLDGKLVAHRGADLPVAALTNDSYAASLKFAAEVRGALPGGADSLPRFARAADRVRRFRGGDPVAYAFATLDDVHSPNTQWSIVYELDRGAVHFRTLANPRVRTIALAKLDFSCGVPARIFDMAAGAGGDITASLVPYSREANLRLIRSSFAQTRFLAKTPAAEMERLAAQPESLTCR
jgi:penicillin V acylase-like amidase (Ntn superfamily)